MFYPISDLLKSVDPIDQSLVEGIVVELWVHPEGRGLPTIVSNLLDAIEAESQRLALIAHRNDHSEAHWVILNRWRRGLHSLRSAISRLDNKAGKQGQDGIGKSLKELDKHPLSGHGFTSNPIYAAAWNQYERRGNAAISERNAATQALYRRLQWWWLRAQAHVITKSAVKWADYEEGSARQESGSQGNDSNHTDWVKKKTSISFQDVGRALRRLASHKHKDYIDALAACCVDDLVAGLQAFTQMAAQQKAWASPDSGVQEERQGFTNAFRLVAEKILDRTKIRPSVSRTGGKRDRQGDRPETDDPQAKEMLSLAEPPEALPEFEEWIPSEEVIADEDEDDTEEDEGVEAPRRTGLKLVHPDALKGHMARAKSQSHHVMMVSHGFSWDHNTLSPSERSALKALVEEVCSKVASSEPSQWWPKAMLATSWISGRPLEEVMTLACPGPKNVGKAEGEQFAVVQTGNAYWWRWPLRLPNKIKVDAFTEGVPRVDHVLVPDHCGLAAALFRAHQLRGVSGTQVFGWPRKPEERLQKAKAQSALLKGGAVDRAITPAMIERDLRITLLNLAPDKTIAWQLAGTKAEAREPRMFYASHSQDEMVNWAVDAQRKMGVHQHFATSIGQGKFAAVWPPAYAGTKFLPDLVALRSLIRSARERASRHPPPYLLKPAKNLKHTSEVNAYRKDIAPWRQEKRWREWNDDVVFWTWLVQVLQSSQRATRFPADIYQQWLQHGDRSWLSLEDKRTRDRDESRSGVMTPMLSSAFLLLTQVQAMFRTRWAASAKNTKKSSKARSRGDPLPLGLMVFDGAERTKDLTPAWLQGHMKSRLGVTWPVNFNRATLRRALFEEGMDGDELDAFLGHGDMADRVHDRHSLFDVGAYHHKLHTCLSHWAKRVNLNRLDLSNEVRPQESAITAQRKRALRDFERRSQAEVRQASPRRRDENAVAVDFVRWTTFVSTTLRKPSGSQNLDHLKRWHARLLGCGLPFAGYVLGQESPLALADVPHTPEALKKLKDEHQRLAKEFEDAVIGWVSGGDLERNVAAHGINLSYLLCKAMSPEMPTTRVAITAHARVSPFTTERVARAVLADQWRGNLLKALPSPTMPTTSMASLTGAGLSTDGAETAQMEVEGTDEISKVKLSICTFMNLTAQPDRWRACVGALSTPSLAKTHLFDAHYNFQIKGHLGRMRDCRGFLDAVSTHVSPLPELTANSPSRARDLYRTLRPESVRVATDLGQWVQGIRWFSHMLLPPLVAAALEGSANDQSAQGPLARNLGWPETTDTKGKSRSDSVQDSQEAGVLPSVLHDIAPDDIPFGWQPELTDPKAAADQWLRAYLWQAIGGARDTTALEDLSDALDDALQEVPGMYRKRTVSLVAKLRKHHGLHTDESADNRADQVDRHVIDFRVYNQLLKELEIKCATSYRPARQRRMRLLIVLAFRFGMRRTEILFLRAGDVDLQGEGRIHIRPYPGHTLKTGFSKRSLPIAPLLNDQERAWLAEACDLANCKGGAKALLIPKRQHDTLPRDAIDLLRKVGDDRRLKLHHLRHSFGSWMLVKVVCARHPEWAELFKGHPETYQEMSNSSALVGTVLKPQRAAGDFLVIPRMLGHSSYEVSLTNYVHTLDLVTALFVHHKASSHIVPQRHLVHLINRRYADAVNLRTASVQGYPEVSAPGTGEAVGDGIQEPWSKQVKECLVAGVAGSNGSKVVSPGSAPFAVDAQQLQNWHSPRHALGLRDKLLSGVDRLDAEQLSLLVKLGKIYWRDNPPMFWFSHRQVTASSRPEQARSTTGRAAPELPEIRGSVAELLRLLRLMGLSNDDVFFWRYQHASPTAHELHWNETITEAGFDPRYGVLGGSSTAAEPLGVSLGSSSARRSPLVGTLWRALGMSLPGRAELG